MDLALFDFDGTITTEGTYPGFVGAALGPGRKVAGGLLLAPLLIGYKGGLVSDRAIRKAMSRVAFWNDDAARLRSVGEQYAKDTLPGLIRSVALEKIMWHKDRGDMVVVVSASLDVYLAPWCRAVGVDVICTQLEENDGRFTGRYVNGDCCGEEKATRVRRRYTLSDYQTIHAYGDTEEDRQMLEIADKKYFRWNEVQEVPAASRATQRGDGGP
jgi:HAD superfamily hydrolase (TIGR01490 family)